MAKVNQLAQDEAEAIAEKLVADGMDPADAHDEAWRRVTGHVEGAE